MNQAAPDGRVLDAVSLHLKIRGFLLRLAAEATQNVFAYVFSGRVLTNASDSTINTKARQHPFCGHSARGGAGVIRRGDCIRINRGSRKAGGISFPAGIVGFGQSGGQFGNTILHTLRAGACEP